MTMTAKDEGKELSKKILGMKFMQRKAESEYRNRLGEEQRKIEDESHWVLPGSEIDEKTVKNVEIDVEPSIFAVSEQPTQGRRSFKNFSTEKIPEVFAREPVRTPSFDKINDKERSNHSGQKRFHESPMNDQPSKKSKLKSSIKDAKGFLRPEA